MTIQTAKQENLKELKNLWANVFDEDPVFLEHFFSTRFSPDHILCAWEDGILVSALHALPSSYQQNQVLFPCSFIVGAATYPQYRKRGIMAALLAETKRTTGHPCTLFPAVRTFYENNGYTTTSFTLGYSLAEDRWTTNAHLLSLDLSYLDSLYTRATAQRGSLCRDKEAWTFLTDGYETIVVENGYAFVDGNTAVETMALTLEGAKALLSHLQAREIQTLQTIPLSPIAQLLGTEQTVPIPMGMSTEPTMQGVYIAEQY